jgi:hypothetical protein
VNDVTVTVCGNDANLCEAATAEQLQQALVLTTTKTKTEVLEAGVSTEAMAEGPGEDTTDMLAATTKCSLVLFVFVFFM